MQLAAARPWITAGVAIAGAGMIAVTPVTPPLPDIQSPAIELSALTTGPIEAWADVLQQAFANGGVLFNDYFSQPLPVLSQVITNAFGYLQDLPNIGGILEQIGDNLVAGIQAPFIPDIGTLASGQGTLFALLPGLVLPDTLRDVADFTASNASGVLAGELGVVISPVVALIDQIQAASAAFEAGTPLAGLTDLVNIPAAVTGGFLNGVPDDINLYPLLETLGISNPLVLPTIIGTTVRITVNSLDLGNPGLLSPGGSLFNDIGSNLGICATPPLCGGGLTQIIDAPANQAGPIGSLINTFQFIAHEIANPSPAAAGSAAELSALMNGGLFGDLPTSLNGLFGDLPTSLSGLLGDLSADVNGMLAAPVDLLSSVF